MTSKIASKEFRKAFNKSIGSAIRARRGSIGVTQNELSKIVGVRQPTISAIERGSETSLRLVVTVYMSLYPGYGEELLWIWVGKFFEDVEYATQNGLRVGKTEQGKLPGFEGA